MSVATAVALLATTESYAACISLSTNSTVVGMVTDCVVWSGGNLTLTNAGTLTSSNTAPLTASAAAGTLLNNGLLSGTSAAAVVNTANALSIVNNSRIISDVTGINNSGTISSLNNNNGGTISGGISGIINTGLINTLSNNAGGSITDTSIGIQNDGFIVGLRNDGDISGATGIKNNGSIASLSNSNIISGATYGIHSDNDSSISTLTNNSTGTITGQTGILAGNVTPSGLINITTLTNAGYISGTTNVGVGTSLNATIGTLTNSGTITGSAGGIGSAGTINALNNSGTISSNGYAVFIASTGTIGSITNTGLIAGTIANMSNRVLTINGDTGAGMGTLTGVNGSIGSISSTSADLVFGTGKLLLNDHINVGSHSVLANAGSALQVNNVINITGNYTQAAGSTLNIGVADNAVATGVVSTDSGYGRLLVSGVATFDAGAAVSLKKINAYSFASGQRFVVVQANTANANFNASQLNYSADGYSGSVTGTSVVDTDDNTKTDLMLTLGSSGPNVSATSSNAISSLSGLFRYGGTNLAMLDMFNAAAALDTPAAANRAGAQLSPAATTTSTVRAAQETTQAVANIISARIDSVRISQTAGGSGVATGEQPNDIAVWSQVLGGHANQGNRSDTSGYSANYGGLLLGADTGLNDKWRIGGAFSYADTSVDNSGNNNGSSAKIKSYGLTTYAGYTTDKWYLNLSGSVVQHKYNAHRSIDYTGFSGLASGKFDGMQYTVSALAGYPIALDAVTTLTPIAGLTYGRLSQDGYTETDSVAALNVSSARTYSLKSDIGAKLERSYQTSYGQITPSMQLTWRHEYRDTNMPSVANFAADSNGATSFTTQGALNNRDTGVLVLRAGMARSDNLSLAARYTLEATHGYTAQTADLQVRYQF